MEAADARGGRKKTGNRRTSAPARKKNTYVPSFFFNRFVLVRFGAFLGQGSSKTRKQLSTFLKNTGGIFFRGGFFFRVDFFYFFFLSTFLVALVKRLSVRGTQKRDKKCFTGSCV
jgi:hypothetical protein